jgi:hypothetical protein
MAEGSPSTQHIAATEFRATLEKIGGELESQTKQFSYITRLDFLIQFSAVAAVLVVVMTLLGHAWVGMFFVIVICGLLGGLRWLQVQMVLASIDKIRDLVK